MLKDSKSLETCCYVIGAGAFGIFFRWMQLQLAFEAGLPENSVWHVFILLLIAASAAVFLHFIRKFDKAGLSVPDNFFEALSNNGKLYTVLRWLLGGILCAGSVLLFMSSELDANVTFLRVLAGFGLLSGISFPLLLSCANRPHAVKNSTVTLLTIFPLFLFATWLLTSYKQNSINPIIWTYAIEVLTLIVDMLAFFRIAGFAYGVPDWKKTMFNCMLGAMLSLMSLADNRYLGQQVMFAAVALMFIMVVWIMIANLREPDSSAEAFSEEAEEDDIPVERL